MSIPQIMYISARKRLFDLPDNDRKLHLRVVPNLGGIGIFFAYITTCSLFLNPESFKHWNYIIASSLLLFLTGIMDDLVSLNASKKFFAQFIAAFITVCIANIRLTSLHGIFGVHELTYWYSAGFSIVGIIFITNAFNLIDGIDGLAGTIGGLCTFSLGLGLAASGNAGPASLAFSLMGAIVGFLRFNTAPARIFMGDTGSLLIGFTISTLCIIFVNSFDVSASEQQNLVLAGGDITRVIHSPHGALLIGLAILFVPVFDSFRVFTTRIMKGVSPFKADRTHLHHYLLDLGFTHTRTVTILITANILIITVSLLLQDLNPNIGILSILILSFGLFAVLYYMRKHRMESATYKKPPISSSKVTSSGDIYQKV
ncbi:MAG: undecaprenyl/decaprenyl-phosphate alpha-N-acetylglucosaminyl 1-phosphate transferase [Bacteroidetes bacterium]|nr:undecaprenyl/decaprenyl-phosphate alpha-N-acetylglucosaminyl 1-phosphate transferase [Bacteroidota bacterium]